MRGWVTGGGWVQDNGKPSGHFSLMLRPPSKCGTGEAGHAPCSTVLHHASMPPRAVVHPRCVCVFSTALLAHLRHCLCAQSHAAL